MAVVITGSTLSINAVDLTNYLQQVEISISYADNDSTTMGSGGRREHLKGIADGTFSATMFQSWAGGAVDATISPLLGTVVEVVVKPAAGGVSATNPSYTFDVLVKDWTPISASAGELTMASVSWPISGAITEATS